MSLIDRITGYVVGRGTVERHEQRRLERHYEELGVEEALRNIKTVETEPALPPPTKEITDNPYSVLPPPQAFIFASPRPISSIKSPRSQFTKSEPELYSMCDVVRYLQGPPDLTAVDLSEEELRRTYSAANTLDRTDLRHVPMSTLQGVGKFRYSTNADPEWVFEQLDKHTRYLSPTVIEQLSQTNIAEHNAHVWQRYKRERASRAESFASSASSRSMSSNCVSEEYVDAVTGTRVTRGFVPSNTSSAASSLRENAGFFKRDSTVSSPGSASPIERSLAQRGKRNFAGSMAYAEGRHRSSPRSPLKTIKELQFAGQIPRKIERPCRFDAEANNESAVASDASDDEDENWSDSPAQDTEKQSAEHTMTTGGQKNATQKFKSPLTRTHTNPNERARVPASNKGVPLERSKTIRARPQFRRHHSAAASTNTQRDTAPAGIQECNINISQSENLHVEPIEEYNTAATGTRDQSSDGENSSTSGLYMFEVERKELREEQKSIVDSDCKLSNHISVEGQAATSHRNQRNRSDTAFRIDLPQPAPTIK